MPALKMVAIERKRLSFIFVESSLQSPDFAKRVSNGLSANHDMVAVFDPGDMSASFFGALRHIDVLQGF